MSFFKGYVKTKDKKCMEKFKNRSDFKTYDEIKDLSEYAGILADNSILIDIDDSEQAEIMMNIVEDLQLDCRVYQTTRGKHFLFYNTNIDKCYTKCKLACGITADIKVGCKNSYEVLKYNNVERFCEWDIEEGGKYQSIPKWMTPIKSNIEFKDMESGDGRNQALFNYILTLQSSDFSIEEAKETIKIINKYILKDSLSEDELEVIIRDEAFKKPIFYKGNAFLFDKFAMFLKNNHHIKRINNQLHLFKDGIYVAGQSEIESVMIQHIPQLNRAKRTEVMSYLDILIRDNTPTASANLIAFRNGIFNIETNELIPYSPNIVITNKIDWDYNKNAYSEDADEVLDNISCKDPEIRKLLEELVGYCLYRRNELGKAFILIGSGSNGKSTYLNMLKDMLGRKNTSVLDLKKLNDRFSTVMMFGKLANIGDDISEEFITDVSEFKKIVTGETIDAEQKGQPKFEFNPYVKLIFSANNIPRMGKGRDSTAILRRLVIVPFNAKFTKESLGKDFKPYITHSLKSQESMEYLIKLGVEGLKRVLENKEFTTSEKIKTELIEYEENNNPILAFFKDCDDREQKIENEPTNDVYRLYTTFCAENGFQSMSIGEFSKQVKKYYNFTIIRKRINGEIRRIFVPSEEEKGTE